MLKWEMMKIEAKKVSKSMYPYYGYDEYGRNDYEYDIEQPSMIELWNKIHPDRRIKNNEDLANNTTRYIPIKK